MAPLLLLLAFLHVLTATKRVPQSDLCIDVKSECERDLSCTLAYLKFEKDCPNIEKARRIIFVSNAQTTIPRNCSIACVLAIEKLKETKKGSGLHTCDCNLDGNCLTLKAHVAKCLMADDVWRTRTSCTMARVNCSRDKHCNELQKHFLLACNNMISGVGCEDKCLKAQTKLLENEYGKDMFDCECDGVTEVFCRGVQANAKQLRCLPGMDGSGTRVFEYRHTDIIYGGEDIRNSSCAPVLSYVLPWTLVLLLTLIM